MDGEPSKRPSKGVRLRILIFGCGSVLSPS